MMRTLEQYHPWMKALFQSLAEKGDFRSTPDLSEILREHPKLVVALNHSTPLSWLPAISFLTDQVAQSGGLHRRPRGIVDRWFYSNPLTAIVAAWISQSERALNFQQLVASAQMESTLDLVVFPEGALSFFQDPDQVGLFRSPRFVELAISIPAPLLLVAHQGSEHWSNKVDPTQSSFGAFRQISQWLPGFFGQQIRNGKPVFLPFPGGKIQNFQMAAELYCPQIQLSELSDDPIHRREQISQEAERVRARMIALRESLRT